MQGIERNPKLGYYRVGTEIFYSKPRAYMYATEIDRIPEWVFNPLELAKFDWTHEPTAGIQELYRLRALQLREQYDWIRLETSGGGDSTTAVFAFLLNGIHLDEVVFRYPEKFDKNLTDDPFNTKPENTLSERQFAAEPLLNWIETHYPKVKVTIQDYSENFLNGDYMTDESWVFTTRDWFQPGHGAKFGNFNTIEHKRQADSGKKICALYGIDKPKACVMDNKWYVYYVDLQANATSPIINDYDNITSELFYWTPDMPEIVAKQAHMIKNWFDMPQHQQFRHLVDGPKTSTAQRTTYEWIVKSIIYPDYDLSTWQTSKPTNVFFNEMDTWFHVNLADTKFYSTWESGIGYLIDKIDLKFFHYDLGDVNGLEQSTSTFYYIGDSQSIAQTPAFVNRDYKRTYSSSSGMYSSLENKKIKKIVI
jgi:hypothetical protein